MKRILAVFIALCLCLALAACAGNPLPSESGTSSSAPMEKKTVYVQLTAKTISRVGDEETVNSIITNVYDDQGVLVSRTYQYDTSWTYTAENDAYGRVTRLTCTTSSGTAVMEYTYDQQGNVLSIIASQDGVAVQTEQNTYDADGNLLTHELIAGDYNSKEVYTYQQGKVTKKELYRDGTLSQYEVYNYDDQGRILSRETHLENGALWATSEYTYSEDGLTTYINCEKYKLSSVEVRDANGNLLRTESIDAGGGSITEYTYQAIEIPQNYPRQN